MLIVRDAAGVHRALNQIAADPSKIGKVAMVKEAIAQSPLFLRVVKAALDPYTTFGIAKMPLRDPALAPGLNTLDEPLWWSMLSDLAVRSLTGNEARERVAAALGLLTPASGDLLTRIIKKDLRAGFSEETVNKACPKTIPTFPYMRCSLPKDSNWEKWNWADGIIVQEKADGMFLNIEHDAAGIITITSRAGSLFPIDKLDRLVESCQWSLAKGTQSHGEAVVYVGDAALPRQESNGVMNSILAGGEVPPGHTVRYLAWDQIPLSAVVPKGKYEVPYRDRLRALIAGLTANKLQSDVKLCPTSVVKTKAEAMAVYSRYLKAGKEGAVAKHPLAIWRDGNSKDQVKLKLKVPVELKVVGFNEGTGKFVGQLGSLVCETEDSLLRVNVSGRGDAMRAEVWANQHQWLGSIITANSNSIMSPEKEGDLHSLFLPIFEELRMDKSVADTLQQVRDQFDAAVNA